MNPKITLLSHPFYQAWSHGRVSREQLSRYAASYAEFISLMPDLWCRIGLGLGVDASHIIAEEAAHIDLWSRWAEKLPAAKDAPRLSALIDGLAAMTPSELLGAVHAFEVQQPEVAVTKKAGLLQHYGFAEADTKYFDEHMNEQEHIEFGEKLAAKANRAEFEAGFDRGAELVYHSLDQFCDKCEC